MQNGEQDSQDKGSQSDIDPEHAVHLHLSSDSIDRTYHKDPTGTKIVNRKS
jgi:hypothetical protein